MSRMSVTGDESQSGSRRKNQTFEHRRIGVTEISVQSNDIGDIQNRLGVPASTLAFHLGGLVGVGLVSQEKVGREVICRAKHRQLTAVMEFLREECCKGFEDELPAAALRRAS